ncbi:MAG: hypothetical protein WA389_11995 [Terriglobales bacterium]
MAPAMPTPKLGELVGSEIVLELLNPVVRSKSKKDKTQKARLVGVEPAGIWIEFPHETTDILLEHAGAMLQTPVFFLPFSQVRYIFVMGDLVALSEKAFGVSE